MAEKISRIASDFETQLSGAVSVGDTSFVLQSVTDMDGNSLSDGIWCFTLDRDSSSAKEYLIGQLTAATKTVSNVSSVSRQGVLTSGIQNSHRIGANIIISDHSVLAAISRIFNGQGTIDPSAPLAYDSAPTLSSATQLATKGYVDSVVTGGTVNTDRIILGSQTAGETVAAGQIVYFKSSDSRWWLADADLTATFQNVQLGVALGAGTAGNTISGGVLIYGKCDSFTGLTATATYYLSNTAGGVSSSVGTYSVILGQAFSTTGIFFNPNTIFSFTISASAGAGDAGKVPKLNGSGYVDETMIPFDYLKTVVYNTGIITRNIDGGNGTVNVAHGLSVVPKCVRLKAYKTSGSSVFQAFGFSDGTHQSAYAYQLKSSSSEASVSTNSTSAALILFDSTSTTANNNTCTISFDATNIIFSWTDTGGNPSTTINIVWEVEGFTI